MKGRAKIATDALRKSKYFLSASGCRNVDYDELYSVIKTMFESESIKEDLDVLYSHHPKTIEMNRALQESNCPNFTDKCDCFLPDANPNDIKCKRDSRELDHRNHPEYFKWRRMVFERDHFTCQNCGQIGGELNAHHINPFKKFPELRLNLENGITYCEYCHKEVHRDRN